MKTGHDSIFREFFYRASAFAAQVLSAILFFDIRVTGTRNIPKDGSFIMASNHVGHLDPYILATIFPRKIYYMANPAIPLSIRILTGLRMLDTMTTIKEARQRILEGKTVGFFPEGGKNSDGRIEHTKSGVGFLAIKTGAKVVPVKITGTDTAFDLTRRKITFRAKISITIGEAIVFDDTYYAKPMRIASKEATQLIMHKIQALG